MPFTLPDLPFERDALGDLMSAVDWEFVARNLDGEGADRADQAG